jgi:hypothetical protein
MEKVCCRCKKNKEGDRWVSPKIRQQQIVSYGYCPSCYQEIMVRIEKAYEFRCQRLAIGGVN